MLTKRQQAQRQRGVGSSDVPVILGLSRWKSAYDLWLERTARVDCAAPTEAMNLGNAIEPLLLKLAAERLRQRVVRPNHTFVGGKPHHRANIDGMVGMAKRGYPIVEAKSTGYTDGWGADGTEEVPSGVRAQVMYQLAIASSTTAHVACLRADRGLSFTLHPIAYDESFAAYILDQVDKWWECVVSDVAPPNSGASLECAKRLRVNDSGDHSEIDAAVVQNDLEARAALVAAQDRADSARAALLVAMRGNRRGSGGGYAVSLTTVATERFDAANFKQNHPDIAAQYTVQSGYKRLTIRKETAT